MDRWSIKYSGKAVFVCVGCAGGQLATQFAKELRLKNCHITYVDQANGPRWGQLGCSGFIVLNGAGKVLSKCTSAFMEVRELAFAHVEALVDALVDGHAPPAVCPGQQVVLHGLSKAELNGQKGLCVGSVDGETGRFQVQMMRGGKRLAVKPANARLLGDGVEEIALDDADSAKDAGRGCQGGG